MSDKLQLRIIQLEAAIAFLCNFVAPDDALGFDLDDKVYELAERAGRKGYPSEEDYANAVIFAMEREASDE